MFRDKKYFSLSAHQSAGLSVAVKVKEIYFPSSWDAMSVCHRCLSAVSIVHGVPTSHALVTQLLLHYMQHIIPISTPFTIHDATSPAVGENSFNILITPLPLITKLMTWDIEMSLALTTCFSSSHRTY